MVQEHRLFISGEWCGGSGRDTRDVLNPATGEVVATVCYAEHDDLDRALESTKEGFSLWRNTSPWTRAEILRRCAKVIEDRTEFLAEAITREQGKPLAESRAELVRTAEVFEWCAGESVRTYGRLLPQRAPGLRQTTIKEPIGPIAGFSPWNFPAVLTARKIAAAIGAGCSIIIKPSEEAPSIATGLVQACQDAGIPKGVLNLVFGDPQKVSTHLIQSPVIRKISLTGSISVGRTLSAMAGKYLKPATMELGGHAPVIIFQDADIRKAARMTVDFKFRNAGQVCLGVSRVYVHESIFTEFLRYFGEFTARLKVGDGMQPGITMGPLANARGISNMERVVADSVDRRATIRLGGGKIGQVGYFWEPTILTQTPEDSILMTEEPFGPVVPITPFGNFDEVLQLANRLDYGLAAYAFTRSLETATNVADELDAGWIGINNFCPALAEVPFGGMKDSGFGYEGGPEGFNAYCQIKFVSQAGVAN